MLKKHKGKGMKKVVFFCVAFIFIISCSVQREVLHAEADGISMIGGKNALLQVLHYPEEALEKGIEGIVTIQAYIDTNGIVRNCKILSGNEYLNDAAVSALRQQRFEPYMVGGKKSPVQVIFPINFTLAKDVNVRKYDRKAVIEDAEAYFERPVKVLPDLYAERSPGGIRDYYSESLYWWPQQDPAAPWVYRDSIDPHAFRDHAETLAETGEIVSTLGAAIMLSNNTRYVDAAAKHVRAWFIDPESAMEPHLRFAQAIPNRSEGRRSGIYEGLPLAELIRVLPYIEASLSDEEKNILQNWLRDFAEYLHDTAFISRGFDTGSLTAFLLYLLIADHLQDPEALQAAELHFRTVILPECLSMDSPLFDPLYHSTFDHDIFIHTELLYAAAQVFLENGTDYLELRNNDQLALIALPEYIRSQVPEATPNYRGRFLFFLYAGKYRNNNSDIELWKNLEGSYGDQADFALRQPLLWIKR